jgi:hypothetical protein
MVPTSSVRSTNGNVLCYRTILDSAYHFNKFILIDHKSLPLVSLIVPQLVNQFLEKGNKSVTAPLILYQLTL